MGVRGHQWTQSTETSRWLWSICQSQAWTIKGRDVGRDPQVHGDWSSTFAWGREPALFFYNIVFKNPGGELSRDPTRLMPMEGFEGPRWVCTHKCEVVHLYINHTNCLNKGKSSEPFEMSQEWPCMLSQMVHAPEASILLCAWAIHFGPDKRRAIHSARPTEVNFSMGKTERNQEGEHGGSGGATEAQQEMSQMPPKAAQEGARVTHALSPGPLLVAERARA